MVEQLAEENLAEETKSIINLSSLAFEQLLQLGLDANHVLILEGLKEGTDLSLHITSPKLVGWKQTLIRKSYLDLQGAITQSGIQLLEDIFKGGMLIVKKKREKREVILNDFDKWWKAYPGTDNFTYKEKTFKGARSLRKDMNECILKMNKILKEEEYTIEEMIGALELEKFQKMELSLKTGQNKMSYFQNSHTYLTQRTFEPFIELIKSGEADKVQKIDNQVTKRIDI